jgi:NADPH:quinone reductase-like Zn-dependent oxidoreductase
MTSSFEFGHLHEGDQVLIMAASSSVGLAAIQIANALGAKSIATGGSVGNNHEKIESESVE